MGRVALGLMGMALVLVLGLVLLFAPPRPSTSSPGIGQGLNSAQIPNGWAPWVQRAGSICAEFPPAVIAAQIEAESGWNPRAVSSKGALGLSQFMPDTWAAMGQDDDRNGIVSPYDPGDAIMAQGRFDCALVQQLKGRVKGDLTSLALAAYNAGPGAVLKYGSIPPYAETQAYVPRILQMATGYGLVTATGTGNAVAAIAAAKTRLGTPYSWGGGGPTGPSLGFAQGANTVGFDCSSLMQYALWQGAKVKIPRTADDQGGAGKPIPRSSIQPGDLIVFNTTHVGMYIGNGQMIHAPQTGDVVKISRVFGNSYWEGKTWRIRRYL